jgi:acetyl esterase/lipase
MCGGGFSQTYDQDSRHPYDLFFVEKMPLTIDPTYAAIMAAMLGPGPPPPKLPVGDVISRRAMFSAFFQTFGAMIPSSPDVSTESFETLASDGHKLNMRWYKKSESNPGSAVLYAHGGGMICLSLDDYDAYLRTYVQHTGVSFLAVEYRLAPEVQSPTLVTDMYAGLQYLVANAAKLGIDTNRIGIMGDSAGGGIVASLAHHIKAQNGPRVSKQILIYPMLDDRTTIQDPFIEPFAVWSTDDNKTGWGAVLGSRAGGVDVTPCEAAGRASVEELQLLPAAYIDVGQLDIFRDECLRYAQRLGEAGVDCELHMLPHMPHAFEGVCPDSSFSQMVMASRMRAITSI